MFAGKTFSEKLVIERIQMRQVAFTLCTAFEQFTTNFVPVTPVSNQCLEIIDQQFSTKDQAGFDRRTLYVQDFSGCAPASSTSARPRL